MKSRRFEAVFIMLILFLTGTLGAAWLTLRRMDVRDRQWDAIVESWRTKTRMANEALRYSSRNNRITFQIFLMKRRQEIDPLLAERAHNSDAISELIKQIENQADSEQEKKLLGAIWSARTPYVDSYKEALSLLLDQRDYERARLKIVNFTLPRLLDYHAAWEEFVRFEGDQMERAASLDRENITTARTRMSYLLGALAVLAVGLGGMSFILLGNSRPPVPSMVAVPRERVSTPV